MDIVSPEDFPWAWWRLRKWQKRGPGNPATRSKVEYLDVVTAFDIETTRIVEIEQSVMYIWQWQFGDRCCVIGRTWPELCDFIGRLTEGWEPNQRIIAFVHNLSYEFSFYSEAYKTGQRREYRRYERRNEGEARVLPVFSFSEKI